MKYFLTFIFIFCFFYIGYAQPYEFGWGDERNIKKRMLDFPVNIRSEPSTSAKIIGKLGLHDEIEILECTEKLQKIDGIDQFWYKIKFNNIIGYIWGGYITIGYYVFDIDKNGINDYIYYRFSDHWCTIKEENDIFIYINNKRIPFDILPWSPAFNECYAFEASGYIYIKLAQNTGSEIIVYTYIYRVNSKGEITYINDVWQTLDDFSKPILEKSKE